MMPQAVRVSVMPINPALRLPVPTAPNRIASPRKNPLKTSSIAGVRGDHPPGRRRPLPAFPSASTSASLSPFPHHPLDPAQAGVAAEGGVFQGQGFGRGMAAGQFLQIVQIAPGVA